MIFDCSFGAPQGLDFNYPGTYTRQMLLLNGAILFCVGKLCLVFSVFRIEEDTERGRKPIEVGTYHMTCMCTMAHHQKY